MKKKGISLVTLIITIIVILILTTAIILTLSNKNAIRSAQVANILQQKDAIEGSVVLYTAKIRVKYEGKCSTESIIRGLNLEGDDLSEYKVVNDEEYVFKRRNSEEIILYMINPDDFNKKANLKTTTPIPKSHWYLDKYGRAYLLFDLDAKIPEWFQFEILDGNAGGDPPGFPHENPDNIDDKFIDFVGRVEIYVGNAPGSCISPLATIPTKLRNEVSPNMFTYSDYDSNGNVLITGIDPIYSASEVPSEIKFPYQSPGGHKVIGIAANAFNGSNKMSDLTTILIPEGYTTLGDSAFGNLTSLEEIYIPTTIVSNYVTFSPFYNCNNIKLIEIPSALVSAVNNKDKPIEWFSSSKGSIEEVNFVGEVTKISESAFNAFTALKKIKLPCELKEIGNNAFYNCSNVSEDLFIPKDVENIGFYAFSGCKKIQKITFAQESKLTVLRGHSFAEMTSLKKVNIPEGIITLEGYAFNWCTSLEEVYIPSTLVNGGSVYTFSNCSKIKKITISNNVINGNSSTRILDLFRDSVTSITDVELYGEIREIADSTFDGFTALCNISLPDTITIIGTNAFRNCTALSMDLVIPASVTNIKSYAFSNCRSIKSLTFAENSNLTEIGASAFESLRTITKVELPEGLTNVGWYVFSSCYALQEVSIPSTITNFGSYVFSSCSNIKKIKVPISIYLNSDFSDSRTGITEAVIIGSPDKIPSGMFDGFSGLRTVTIPNTITSIESNAFRNCTALSGTINIPAGVTSIGDNAFYNCRSIQAINFAENSQLKSIESSAFQSANSLTRVTLPDGLTNINWYAFKYCNSLVEITIPSSVTNMGSYVFSGCNNLATIHYSGTAGDQPWGAPSTTTVTN